MYPVRSLGATAVAVATTVLLSAQPTHAEQPLRPPAPAVQERADADRGPKRTVGPAARPSAEAERDRSRPKPRTEASKRRGTAPEAGRAEGRGPRGPAAGSDAARGRSLSELLGRLRVVYRESTDASTAYDKATGMLKRQRAKVRKLTKRLDRASSVVERGRSVMGQLARQQYRSSQSGAELPAALRLLLSDHPERMLRGGHVPRHAVSQQSVRLKELIGQERQRDALVERGRKAAAKQRKLSEQRKKHQQRARNRLRAVERLLATLSPAELNQLRQRETDTGRRGALPPLPNGVRPLPGNPDGPREPGRRPGGPESEGKSTDPAAVDGAGKTAKRTGVDVPDVTEPSGMNFLPCYLTSCGFPYISEGSGSDRGATKR